MEQVATPGSILVSAYTHRLIDGYFAFKDLGPTQIKGVEEPLHIDEALGMGQLRTRLQVSASRYGLARFVGRQREVERLINGLEQAKAGHGQIVGTMGEPGLGKSRLFHEFKLLSLSGCLVLEAYSVSHGKATAYLPVIELLKSYGSVDPGVAALNFTSEILWYLDYPDQALARSHGRSPWLANSLTHFVWRLP